MTLTDPTIDRQTWSDRVRQRIVDLDTLCRFVADHPDLPVPYLGYGDQYMIQVSPLLVDDVTAELARITRILMDRGPLGALTKSSDDGYMRITRRFGGATIEAWAQREDVCTRRVTGTETVTVPDPVAPLVEIERDIVEWECASILAGTVA